MNSNKLWYITPPTPRMFRPIRVIRQSHVTDLGVRLAIPSETFIIFLTRTCSMLTRNNVYYKLYYLKIT